MAGLNLHGAANVRAASSPSMSSATAPTSVSQAAWGSGGSAGAGVGAKVLSPTTGFGLAFWLEVAAMAWLVLVYVEAPRRGGER